jgi:signal transduction histidine kinase
MADPVQFQQVFMTLVLNAIEAMRETGGELTIRTEVAHDGQFLISVSDTRVGLPEGKATEVFDASFTTKPQGSVPDSTWLQPSLLVLRPPRL